MASTSIDGQTTRTANGVHDVRNSNSAPASRAALQVSAFSTSDADRDPIRVCFLIDRLGLGGTETQLVALIRHLDRSRVEPCVCLLDGSDELSRSLEPTDCPVLRLGIRSLRRPRTLVKAWQFARFLKQQRVQILQTYFPDSTYFGVPVAWLAGVPQIVQVRNDLGYWRTPLQVRMNAWIGRLIHWTLVNCAPSREVIITSEGIRREATVVLENGVDLERFESIPDLSPNRASPCRIGAVANLRPVKNLELLVEAAAIVHALDLDARFTIAGEGPSRAGLEQLILRRGLGNHFELPGTLRDIPSFLGCLDIAVLCSHSEGMSNALLEYMSAGRAIIATNVGANSQIIQHGVQGLILDRADARSLAHAIHELVRDPARAARLGAAARRKAQEYFSRQAMIGRFERFYENCLGVPGQADAFARTQQ